MLGLVRYLNPKHRYFRTSFAPAPRPQTLKKQDINKQKMVVLGKYQADLKDMPRLQGYTPKGRGHVAGNINKKKKDTK